MLAREYAWLNSLKASQLSSIAVAIGVSSSGRKSAVAQGIAAALTPFQDGHRQPPSTQVHETAKCSGRVPSGTTLERSASIVSIDMGIRTLAYAHLKLEHENRTKPDLLGQTRRLPVLSAWQCLSIAPKPLDLSFEGQKNDKLHAVGALSQPKESFSPELYAQHAYTLVEELVSRFQPTHVLIEKQRFRSGGNAAVFDWTIRVGVFEGMLHAALQTLCQERQLKIEVSSVDPKKVVRYWLGEKATPSLRQTAARKKRASSKEVKDEKVNLVGNWLKGTENQREHIVALNVAAQPMIAAYLEKWNGKTKGMRSVETSLKLSKLDDLADSLLQGLAYIEWENHRARLTACGPLALSDVTRKDAMTLSTEDLQNIKNFGPSGKAALAKKILKKRPAIKRAKSKLTM
ncbi:MAG: hypothetical protein Q9227_000839 [Pyrenula ochraceoflavens]